MGDGGLVVVEHELRPLRREQGGSVLVAPARERLVVRAGVDGGRAEVRRQPHDLALRRPPAQVEAAAGRAQPRVQILQPPGA